MGWRWWHFLFGVFVVGLRLLCVWAALGCVLLVVWLVDARAAGNTVNTWYVWNALDWLGMS